MLPEEKARVKIDKQLNNAGWAVVSRDEFIRDNASAVKEALMTGNTESDYLLFIDGKAIAVVEAKKESNDLGEVVAMQAENYAVHPQNWYGLWFENKIPLVYLANGNKILFKNMLDPESEYEELSAMHTPKKMLKIIGKKSEFGALPMLDKEGLRDCQFKAEQNLESMFKNGGKKGLAVLATGSGKTYLACLASYRMLNYTPIKRVLFLVDRNNLARQTEAEFSLFKMTENKQEMSSLYRIKRLRKVEDVNSDIVISTIQKLYAVLTGQTINDGNEDEEDDKNIYFDDNPIDLGKDLKLAKDYFQLIIIDECHRSIYGKWKAVLDYFSEAKKIGLTATPTPEAYAYFNNNIIENYTYDQSVVDGVNVPSRIYRISTDVTVHGGKIVKGTEIKEKTKKGVEKGVHIVDDVIDYDSTKLDRSIINPVQIETILTEYRDKIYADLYPERKEDWRYIPKTLIFAKDNNHATQIVEIAKKVFAEKFKDNILPENYVKKITYTEGDSNILIRDFRNEKDFRIAVTVTLVATGTDVKPLEVVLFMNDVKSMVLYTQMKGRGCRSLKAEKLKEVTPNANFKECFYVVDAVGVTESEKKIPTPSEKSSKKPLSLFNLLERLSHNELSDENLALLRNYCATINKRYEEDRLFGHYLNAFIKDYGFSPKMLAEKINIALEQKTLPEFKSANDKNLERYNLIYCLMCNVEARKKLVELHKGYYATLPDSSVDTVIYSGFSKENSKKFIDEFERYINENKDKIQALKIIYNSEDTIITHSMLVELRDKLLLENREFSAVNIWKNYKVIKNDGSVSEFDKKGNVEVLTNLIQIVRYAFKKSNKLVSLTGLVASRFSLYCGQEQRSLSEEQRNIMKMIAEYIVSQGAIDIKELNEIDPDLWRMSITNMGAKLLSAEINKLSGFLLKVA